MSAPYDLPASLAAVLQALLAPPAAPRPVASDERSQAIRRELAKLEDFAGDPPDWRKVADLGVALLRDAGKDLLFAAYTALALAKLHALPGVHLGLLALSQILAAQPLTPERPAARSRALDWYLARLAPDLLALTVKPDDAPAIRALPDAIRALRTRAHDVLGDAAPTFTRVLQAAEALCADLPADAGHAPPAASDPPPAASDPSPAAPATAGHVAAGDAPVAAPATAGDAPVAAPATPPDLAEPPGSAPPGQGVPSPLVPVLRAAAPWLAPIRPDQPCGLDPSADEAFVELRTELQKLNAIVDAPIDWKKVEHASGELLRTLAKDLRLAAWFTLAHQRRSGTPGLLLGLVLTAELLVLHGAQLYPRQSRSRRMTAEWFVGRVAAILRDIHAPPDPATLIALETACERFGTVLHEHLGDDAPALRPLRDGLQQIPRDESHSTEVAAELGPASPSTAPVEPSIPPSPPQTAPTVAPVSVQAATSVPAADLAQIDRFLDATDDALVQTARALREAKPNDPRAYRMLRIGIWLRLLAPPPAKPDGTTAVPGLAERDRDALANLAAKEQWLELTHRSENLLRSHRLVLDIQRHTTTALLALGSEYTAAALAVRAEVCSLLMRLPALPTLRDKDGRPLTDPDTQRWIAEHVLPRARAPAPVTTADPDPAFWAELPARLRGDARDSALAEAQQRIDQSPSRQLRFTRSLGLAEAALEAGDHGFAALLYAALTAEAERADLDRWDPPLVVRCLTGAARSHHRRGNTPARDHVLQRLSHLDASATASLLGELP